MVKKHYYLIFLRATTFFVLLISCNSGTPKNPNTQKTSSISNHTNSLFENKAELPKDMVFRPLLDSISPKDSLFLPQLIKQYQLLNWKDATLTHCEYSGLYGSADSIWFIKLQKPNDSLCLPLGAQLQLVFNSEAQLIHKDSAGHATLLSIWKDYPPLLMTLTHDCKNVGQHHFYKYEEGILIDIFNVLMETTPSTMDVSAAIDGVLYQPNILDLEIKDYNNDGWNDLIFKGYQLILKGPDKDRIYTKWMPYKKERVEYVFLFEKNADWFVQK